VNACIRSRTADGLGDSLAIPFIAAKKTAPTIRSFLINIKSKPHALPCYAIYLREVLSLVVSFQNTPES
jgi:hypothetical protein